MKRITYIIVFACFLVGCGGEQSVTTKSSPYFFGMNEERIHEIISEAILFKKLNEQAKRENDYISLFSKAEATEGTKQLASQNNRFALNFYAQLKQEKAEQGKNLFFSPFSLYTVLGMVYLGANDGGKQELAEVLGLQGLGDVGKEFFNLQGSILKSMSEYASIVFFNGLLINDTTKVLPEYENAVKEYFKSEIFRGKFNSPQTPKLINAWVSKNTQGLIPRIVDQAFFLNQWTKLILINTLYFWSSWDTRYEFRRALTENKHFTLLTGEKVSVPMMHQAGLKYKYLETDQMQMVAIPFTGNAARLYCILPKEHTNLAALEPSFTPENIAKWQILMKPVKANSLVIPKVNLIINLSADEILKKLGINDVFNERKPTSLKGIDGGVHSLIVEKIFQKLSLIIYEEGCVAKVETSDRFSDPKSEVKVEPKDFTFEANRPFLFFIADTQFDTILFMGRVMNPAEK